MPIERKLDRNEYLRCVNPYWAQKEAYYSESDKQNRITIKKNQHTGNVGEQIVCNFLREIGIQCNDPFFEEYADPDRSKIWDMDTMGLSSFSLKTKKGKLYPIESVTVKSQLQGTSKWCAKQIGGTDWEEGASFMWQLSSRTRYQDPLLSEPGKPVLVFGVIVDAAKDFYNPPDNFVCKALVSAFYWPAISKKYWSDPIKKNLKGKKKIIYRKDIIHLDIINRLPDIIV